MERGKEGKGGNNEWGCGGEGEGERGGERKKWLQKWSIGEKHKKVDGRLLSLVKTRCGIYPVTYFWTCPSLRSSWPFPFHWSLINSLYSLLFTMHEIGPSVRAWSTIWTRYVLFPFSATADYNGNIIWKWSVPPFSSWPLCQQPQPELFFSIKRYYYSFF